MSVGFDPYHKWLGISPEEQPADHYRLLGIKRLESDLDVIQTAADRQMAHLRTYQAGEHSDLSQRILNEVAAAKLVLLSTENKRGYDAELRAKYQAATTQSRLKPRQLARTAPIATAVPLATSRQASSPAPSIEVAAPELPVATRLRNKRPAWHMSLILGGAVAGLIVVAVIVAGGSSDADPTPNASGDSTTETETPRVEVAEAVKPLQEMSRPPQETKPRSSSVEEDATPETDPGINTNEEQNTNKEEVDTSPEVAVMPTTDPPSTEIPPDSPSGGSATDIARLPVPSEEELKRSTALVKEVLADEIAAAKKPEAKLALAKKLLDQALETHEDPPGQYVLLQLASREAQAAGNVALALKALDAMVARFEIEGGEPKTALIEVLAKRALGRENNKAIAEAAQALVEEWVAAENFDEAEKLGALALAAARKGRDLPLVKTIVARNRQIEEFSAVFAAMEEARAKLESDPDDPEANLAVGRYLCFFKEDWSSGLPLLAKGGDEELKAVVAQDLAVPGEPDNQVALAALWWDLAINEGIDSVQVAMRRRAGHWYAHGLAKLSGITKVKVERRLKEIGVDPDEILGGVLAERVVIWNSHNSRYNNIGASRGNLILFYRGKVAWRRDDIAFPWSAGRDEKFEVKLPRVRFDRLRVEITERHGLSGGLAEIQVFRGESNIASGATATASGSYNNEERLGPRTINDGITTSAKLHVGYWHAPGEKNGWIELDFNSQKPVRHEAR